MEFGRVANEVRGSIKVTIKAHSEPLRDSTMRALEVTGTVDHSGQLHLDQPLTAGNDQRVRVIVLIPETDNIDISETAWLQAAASDPVFAFLHDPEEDIYTLNHGKPFNDKE